MKRNIFILAAVAGAVLSFAAATTWAGSMVLDPGPFTSSDYGSFTAPVSVGWSFTTTQAITVVALDDLTGTFNGYTGGLNVRIYGTNQSTLASATLTTSDVTEATASGDTFYTVPITPLTLSANTTYYIVTDGIADTSFFVIV